MLGLVIDFPIEWKSEETFEGPAEEKPPYNFKRKEFQGY